MERKLLKIALVVASSLLLSFSAFADDGEASDLPIEEVTHDIELVNDSSLEASEISNDNLAEILGGPLRSPSINPNGNFQILGVQVLIDSSKEYPVAFSLQWDGSLPDNVDHFTISFSSRSARLTSDFNYISTYNFNYGNGDIKVYLRDVNDTNLGLVFSQRVNITENSNNEIFYNTNISDLGIASYLSFVGNVFTWLLSTIGTLIIFIMGNPFLAVSLFLFLAGTVISFFIRIKNA